MSHEYSEDNLIESTAMNLLFHRLGWDTAFAYNKAHFGRAAPAKSPPKPVNLYQNQAR